MRILFLNFNPIIVLFLTGVTPSVDTLQTHFNPIIVLFLTKDSLNRRNLNPYFNPIIVLFLTTLILLSLAMFVFQSYYSLIFNLSICSI